MFTYKSSIDEILGQMRKKEISIALNKSSEEVN
jgi:hypothetical protein